MAKNKQTYTGKTKEELLVAVSTLRAEIHKATQENATHQLKSTTSLRTKRDELARALTALHMVQLTVSTSEKSVRKTGKEEAK